MPKTPLVACLLALLALGCSGTETGNPGKSTAALSLAAHSSSSELVAGPGAAGVRVESAWLEVAALDQIACDGGPTVRLAEGFAVDLLGSGQGMPEIRLAEPALCALELGLAPGPGAADAPAELGASSIVVSGTRADDAPFVIATPAVLGVTLEPAEPLDPTGHQALLFAFDLAIWLGGTDLAAVPLDDQGVARLDGVLHPSTVETFDAQIAPGAGLYPDLDADGALDDDERAPLAGH